MKKIIILLLLSLASSAVQAEFYVKAGFYYSNKKGWVLTEDYYRESSSVVGHLSAGYEMHIVDNLSADFHLKHESDPNYRGARDLVSKEMVGVTLKYTFK